MQYYHIINDRFLVHFLEIFASLVQIEPKYNKLNLCNNYVIRKE
jgi:hypothetical protein